MIENPSTPAEAKAEEKSRPLGLREENLPGHLQNPQLMQELKEQKDQKEKELKEKEQLKSEKEKEKDNEKTTPQSGGENTENDVQLRRALEMLKGWDVFKQLVLQKQAG